MGVHRHDIHVSSQPFLYFCLDWPPAARYHEIHSGVVDTAPVQAEMIGDLTEERVGLIFLAHMFPDDFLDRNKEEIQRNQPQIDATALDRFIRANYTQSKRFGEYPVLLGKPVAVLGANR